jgi:hypothetical protein
MNANSIKKILQKQLKLTFFVVIEELGGTTQTDHLDSRTSKTHVSGCPEVTFCISINYPKARCIISITETERMELTFFLASTSCDIPFSTTKCSTTTCSRRWMMTMGFDP